MANFIKVGDKYLNLDRVQSIVDKVPTAHVGRF